MKLIPKTKKIDFMRFDDPSGAFKWKSETEKYTVQILNQDIDLKTHELCFKIYDAYSEIIKFFESRKITYYMPLKSYQQTVDLTFLDERESNTYLNRLYFKVQLVESKTKSIINESNKSKVTINPIR